MFNYPHFPLPVHNRECPISSLVVIFVVYIHMKIRFIRVTMPNSSTFVITPVKCCNMEYHNKVVLTTCVIYTDIQDGWGGGVYECLVQQSMKLGDAHGKP